MRIDFCFPKISPILMYLFRESKIKLKVNEVFRSSVIGEFEVPCAPSHAFSHVLPFQQKSATRCRMI